ncbi:MAG: tetratricopeptide repeat protein [Candidatus Binatia bacterium]
MSEEYSRSETLDDVLGPTGEAEWQRLRRQLEFADGFWLGFLFAPSSLKVAALRQRTEQLLRVRARLTRIILPDTPETLRSSLSGLFDQDIANVGCVWIEAIRSDSPLRSQAMPGPWVAAWDDFLLRLNERRDALRRHLAGGLVLAAPPEIKPRVRDAAPDLWSVRALVVELPLEIDKRYRTTDHEGISVGRAASEFLPATTPDIKFALAEAHRLEQQEGAHSTAYAQLLLRAGEGLLEQERAPEAVTIARKAVDVLQNLPTGNQIDLAAALTQLSRAEAADGDLPSARDHAMRAVALQEASLAQQKQQAAALQELSLMIDRLVDIHRELNDLPIALTLCEKKVTLDRRLRDTLGESPQTLRDLSVSLNKLGDVRQENGDLRAAVAAYEESLALRQRLRDTLGESPQTLRDLSVSLGRIGWVQQAEGNYEEALGAYTEALTLDRRRMQRYGQLPQTLQDFAFNLSQSSQIRQRIGDEAGAAADDEERAKIVQQLATLPDVSPDETGSA